MSALLYAFGPFVLLLSMRPSSFWRLPFWPVALFLALVFAMGQLLARLGESVSDASIAGLRWMIPTGKEGA